MQTKFVWKNRYFLCDNSLQNFILKQNANMIASYARRKTRQISTLNILSHMFP